MSLMTRKLSFTISEVKFVYLLFLRNFYFLNHLNNTKSKQILLTSQLNCTYNDLQSRKLMLIGYKNTSQVSTSFATFDEQ
jgi:hypothetical protein